jgi:excisionase family DNA binding protein
MGLKPPPPPTRSGPIDDDATCADDQNLNQASAPQEPPEGPAPPGPATSPSILTVRELADFLRVNHKTVREAIARGEIPGVQRIGGTIRIFRDAVLKWLASGQGRVSRSRRIR